MTFRGRLLATSMLTLAVASGRWSRSATPSCGLAPTRSSASLLRARAEAQIAALDVSRGRVAVRRSANEGVLDREAWVFDGTRLIERPPASGRGRPGRGAARAGRRPGGASRPATASGCGPSPSAGRRRRIGAVVLGISDDSVERLEGSVLLGSLVLAALLLLAGC